MKVVDGLKICKKQENKICEVCVLSKQKCLPYNSKSTRSTRVLELVHTDICGPITPNNKSYFISFVDDFSRFVIVYAVETKDELYDCFRFL